MARALTAKTAAPTGRRSLVWLQGLACGALATMATPVAILLTALLAPGIAALLLDREPGKPVARTVLLFGMAASVYPARTLWMGAMTVANAMTVVSNLPILGLAWGAAAGGWLLVELTPLTMTIALDAKGATLAKALRKTRAQHADAWGLPELD